MSRRRIAAVCAVLMLATGPAGAGEGGIGLGEVFGFSADDQTNLTVTDRELGSLGCIIAGAGTGVAAVLFGGVAIIATRGQGAATATTVAVPVLAATMTAACAFGSQAAPGFAWLRRNADVLLGKVINTIPADPLVKVLPGIKPGP
ncbi:MAG: hypothetical protein WCO00_11840 [Rhodospirillaceae bacterium]